MGRGLRRRRSSLLNAAIPNSHSDPPRPPSSDNERPPTRNRELLQQFQQSPQDEAAVQEPSAANLILLTKPSSYELSLSAMYTHNVLTNRNRSRTPSLSDSLNTASSSSSPAMPSGEMPRQPSDYDIVQHDSLGKDQMPMYASQPLSLPPAFVTGFIRNCFSTDLCDVDFTQALKALDYLKVLDDRRKAEFARALLRLNIDTATFDREKNHLMRRYPELYGWIATMEDKSKKAEALYTQVYIGLRRWTLINEMRLEPFSKNNCVAMLDTLYPTSFNSPPTPQLTNTILSSQRSAFFRYIVAVEKNGRGVLHTLENQSRRPGEANGWPVVRDIVDRYLRQTNSIIDDCAAIRSSDDLNSSHIIPSTRIDSGISFASNPANHPSNHPALQKANRPLPSRSQSATIEKALPMIHTSFSTSPPKQKQQSTFGRLTQKLRRIRSSSTNTAQAHDVQTRLAPPVQAAEPRSSFASLRPGSSRVRSGSGSRPPAVTVTPTAPRKDSHTERRSGSVERPTVSAGLGARSGALEEQRERLIREARKERENKENAKHVKATVMIEPKEAKPLRKQPSASQFRLEIHASQSSNAAVASGSSGSPTGKRRPVAKPEQHLPPQTPKVPEREEAFITQPNITHPVVEMPNYYEDDGLHPVPDDECEERVAYEMPNFEEDERMFGWQAFDHGKSHGVAQGERFELDAGYNPYQPEMKDLMVAELEG